MPGFDGTGPMGAGPMTGGARGFCNPSALSARPGFGRGMGLRRGFGAGYGRGRGYGRSFGWSGYYPQGGVYGPAYGYAAPYGSPYSMSREEEINMLKNDADALSSDLKDINSRIEELQKEQAEQA